MQLGQPSQTALAAATYRAAHQVLEGGRIFADPLALQILGADAQALARQTEENPSKRKMRIFIAARSRFAEEALAAAVERGIRQVVVLGAGLDTYAYRSPFGDCLQIFEVDHPATQDWKRKCLADAGIPLPSSLVFAPLDFERQTLSEGLAAAGFDPAQPTFFMWLGVVIYLSEPLVWSTLDFIAGLPNEAHVVFDYSSPPSSLSPQGFLDHDRRAAHVAELGEKFLTHFETEELCTRLVAHGFTEIEDLSPRQIALRYFPDRGSALTDNGGHVVHAAKGARGSFGESQRFYNAGHASRP